MSWNERPACAGRRKRLAPEVKLAALADIREQIEHGTLRVRQASPEDIAALDAAVARRPVSPPETYRDW